MMTVRLRLGVILARWALWERKAVRTDVSRLAMCCHWTDCDLNRHMNNSRYLALMDLGRYHYVLVSGLARHVLRRGWFPMLVRVEIDFRRPIGPGQRFTLETRITRVGTKSVVLAQRFWLGDELACEALATGLFASKGKAQEVAPLLEERGLLPPVEY